MSAPPPPMHGLTPQGGRRRRGGLFAALLAGAALGGCVVGPNYAPPSPPTEQTYLPAAVSQLGSAGSAETEQMLPSGMSAYGRLCGWTLARAHARSGDRIAITSYLGKGPTFDRAILEFSHAYAVQNEFDYKALESAVKSGKITAETGL